MVVFFGFGLSNSAGLSGEAELFSRIGPTFLNSAFISLWLAHSKTNPTCTCSGLENVAAWRSSEPKLPPNQEPDFQLSRPALEKYVFCNYFFSSLPDRPVCLLGINLNREDVALVFAYVSVTTKLPQFGQQQLEVNLPMYLGTANPSTTLDPPEGLGDLIVEDATGGGWTKIQPFHSVETLVGLEDGPVLGGLVQLHLVEAKTTVFMTHWYDLRGSKSEMMPSSLSFSTLGRNPAPQGWSSYTKSC